MVKKYGNFEVNNEECWVRFVFGDGEYEYIVNEQIFGSKEIAGKATRIFQKGYDVARREIKNTLGVLVNEPSY